MQVRNIEVMINGEVVVNDVSYPFDTQLFAPKISESGDSFTIQVRATDTGGNSTVSELSTVSLFEDTIAPQITNRVYPTEGGGFRTIELDFSEALSIASANVRNFRMVASDGTVLIPSDVQLRNDDQRIQITFDKLLGGSYIFEIDSQRIQDRSGNPLQSDILVDLIELSADIISPEINSIYNYENFEEQNTHNVRLEFSESIDKDSLVGDIFSITDSQQNIISPVSYEFRDSGKSLNISFSYEEVGDYTFILDSSAISDLSGNELVGNEDNEIVYAFVIEETFDYGPFD